VNKASNRTIGLYLAGIALVCAAIYAPSIVGAEYVHDDHPAVVDNPLVTWPPDLGAIFTSSYFGPGKEFAHMPLSRPLVTIGFAAERAIGLEAVGQKFISLLRYMVICVILAVVVTKTLGPHAQARRIGALTGLLFAVHPAHVGVVMSVAYRTEILALMMVLLATWALLEPRARKLAPLLLLIGLLCKESAVCVLAPWATIAWLRRDRSIARMIGAALVVVAAFVAWRATMLGGVTIATIPYLDNPLARVAAGERIVGGLSLVALAAEHLVFPVDLAPDYSFDALRLPAGWSTSAIIGLAIIGAIGAAVAVGLRRRAADAPVANAGFTGLAALWIAAFWSPVANILFAIPVLFADRLLFAPSAGFCALVAALLVKIPDRKVMFPAVVGLIVLGGGLGSHLVAADWKTDKALYTRGVELEPRSVKMRLNLGLLQLREREPAQAVVTLEPGHRIAPPDHDVREALVTAYAESNRCAPGRPLVDRIVAENRAPRAVRVALLKYALACRDFKLANALGKSLGLKRKTR